MILLLRLLSLGGLILTLFPSFLVFTGILPFETHKLLALAGTLLWMGTAPFWINRTKENSGG